MATEVYSARAPLHLERASEFLASENPDAAIAVAGAFGQTGYIALYRFVVPQDEVTVLEIRRQREIGFVP